MADGAACVQVLWLRGRGVAPVCLLHVYPVLSLCALTALRSQQLVMQACVQPTQVSQLQPAHSKQVRFGAIARAEQCPHPFYRAALGGQLRAHGQPRTGLASAFAPCCAASALYEGAAADPCRPWPQEQAFSIPCPAAALLKARTPTSGTGTPPPSPHLAWGQRRLLGAHGDNSCCAPSAALHHVAKLSMPGFLFAVTQPAGRFRQRPARAGKKRKRSLAPRAAEELALDVTAAELSSSQQFAAPLAALPGARAGAGPRGAGAAPRFAGARGGIALLCSRPVEPSAACVRSPCHTTSEAQTWRLRAQRYTTDFGTHPGLQ